MPKPGNCNQRDRLWQPPGLTANYKSSVTRSPSQPLLSLPQTLSEITGPVFGQGDISMLINFPKVRDASTAWPDAVGRLMPFDDRRSGGSMRVITTIASFGCEVRL